MIPLAVALDGRRVLVVGAGPVGARKAAQLLAAGASVEMVATDRRAELPSGLRSFTLRPWSEEDLEGAWLVVSATGDPGIDERIAAAARARRIFCNVVDDPSRSDVYFPAIWREGPVTVAVSTGGVAPALAVWVRDRLRDLLPAGLGQVALAIGRERDALKRQGCSTESMPWRDRIETLLEGRCPGGIE